MADDNPLWLLFIVLFIVLVWWNEKDCENDHWRL